jgi:transcriptional regulator with XRE-family HTH domain
MRGKGTISYEFGVNVKRVRTKVRKITQENLAELCGLTPVYIGEIERGKRNVSLEIAERIANGLAVDIRELLTYDKFESEEDQ